jgi:hypothetical protein
MFNLVSRQWRKMRWPLSGSHQMAFSRLPLMGNGGNSVMTTSVPLVPPLD